MKKNTQNGLYAELIQTHPIPLNAKFHCEPGELLALVGPSGSGKTTILRCITGLNTPTHGRVRCNNIDWTNTDQQINLTPQRRVVGIVFQHYALFPHMSAMDNITAPMQNIDAGERDTRGHDLLALVHLQGLAERRPAELSGGQQQRVALARALAREPTVLLLDEPFSSVDQTTRRKLQRELARLRKQVQIPIILVTHDLEEASLLADRICIIHRGQTLQTGTPTEVMSRPQNPLVARLVNLTNIYQGKILGHIPEKEITLLGWLDYTLECRYNSALQTGAIVDWVIPPQYILLHQRVRPSRGERENPVTCIVEECVSLGESVSITVSVDGHRDTPMYFNVPLHVAHRNQLTTGGQIGVSLLTNGIHFMSGTESTPTGYERTHKSLN